MTDQQTTIQELKNRVREFRAARGWMETDQKDIAISICLEAAELLEHFQWVKTEEVKDNHRWREALGGEIADVMFLLLEIADSFGIDVAEVFGKKLETQAKKYPLNEFNPNQSTEERRRAYHRVKAKTRINYPFRDEGNVK